MKGPRFPLFLFGRLSAAGAGMRNLIERVRRFIIRKIADIFFQCEFTAKILIENSREGVDRVIVSYIFFAPLPGR
jgi:hypothetical protein